MLLIAYLRLTGTGGTCAAGWLYAEMLRKWFPVLAGSFFRTPSQIYIHRDAFQDFVFSSYTNMLLSDVTILLPASPWCESLSPAVLWDFLTLSSRNVFFQMLEELKSKTWGLGVGEPYSKFNLLTKTKNNKA